VKGFIPGRPNGSLSPVDIRARKVASEVAQAKHYESIIFDCLGWDGQINKARVANADMIRTFASTINYFAGREIIKFDVATDFLKDFMQLKTVSEFESIWGEDSAIVAFKTLYSMLKTDKARTELFKTQMCADLMAECISMRLPITKAFKHIFGVEVISPKAIPDTFFFKYQKIQKKSQVKST